MTALHHADVLGAGVLGAFHACVAVQQGYPTLLQSRTRNALRSSRSAL